MGAAKTKVPSLRLFMGANIGFRVNVLDKAIDIMPKSTYNLQHLHVWTCGEDGPGHAVWVRVLGLEVISYASFSIGVIASVFRVEASFLLKGMGMSIWPRGSNRDTYFTGIVYAAPDIVLDSS